MIVQFSLTICKKKSAFKDNFKIGYGATNGTIIY